MSSFEIKELRWFNFWRIAGWFWVIFICYLSLTPKPPLPDMGFEYQDKVGHLFAYAWLMGWFGNLYHCRHARIVFAVIFVLMGVGLEFLQGMGQDRLFEYADMLANTAGVMLGYLLTLGPVRLLLHKTEQLLKSESGDD